MLCYLVGMLQLLWRAWVSQHHTDALFNLGVLYENGECNTCKGSAFLVRLSPLEVFVATDLIAIDEITPPTDFRAAFCKRTKPLLNSNSSVDDEDCEFPVEYNLL